MQTTIQDVLNFWLGPLDQRDNPPKSVGARWWKKDPDFDREIEQRFSACIDAAGTQTLHNWSDSPQGRLALVITLDQFTRNVYRDSAHMYQYDDYALSLATAGIDAGADTPLAMAERYFLYMPLMHAENLPAQDRCVALFTELAKPAPQFAGSVNYAIAHRDIVARFGRFPHRNALLGRASTPEETAFLKEPGSSF